MRKASKTKIQAAKAQTKTAGGSALVPAASRLPSTDQVDGLAKYAKTGAPQWIGDLLKFNGKTGEYTAGSQELPINKGHVFVAAVTEMLAGGVLWKNGELADQIWMPAPQFDWREVRKTLPDQDRALWPKNEDGYAVDPWREAVMLPMIDPNTFAEFTFSSSSVGGVRAAKRLANTYCKQLAAASETTRGCWPVVALQASSYLHEDRKRGKIWNPEFEGLDYIRASDLLLPKNPGEGQEPPPDDGAPNPDLPLKPAA
jgi:hypothetical protein